LKDLSPSYLGSFQDRTIYGTRTVGLSSISHCFSSHAPISIFRILDLGCRCNSFRIHGHSATRCWIKDPNLIVDVSNNLLNNVRKYVSVYSLILKIDSKQKRNVNTRKSTPKDKNLLLLQLLMYLKRNLLTLLALLLLHFLLLQL
jgi:hypothetical protein